MSSIELKVPDIGGSTKVPVIEILVKVGDEIKKDQGLITLESDKATMEVPASAAGTVKELRVKLGDEMSEGDVIAILESGEATVEKPAAAVVENKTPAPVVAVSATPVGLAKDNSDITCQIVVLGAGPGGYTAAFRAADLGMDVVLVERYAQLGGVCLNVGCIPSKALLHAAEVIEEAKHAADYGVSFSEAKIDLAKLRTHKEKVVGTLVSGLTGMAKQRKVRTVTGIGKFISPNQLEIETATGKQILGFKQCIIAAGSQPVKLPGFPWEDPRVMDSTDALMLHDIPKSLLVIGGGIIGLEMATVYRSLGSEVTVVELAEQLMPGADKDLVKPLADRLKKASVAIHLKTRAAKVEAKKTASMSALKALLPRKPFTTAY